MLCNVGCIRIFELNHRQLMKSRAENRYFWGSYFFTLFCPITGVIFFGRGGNNST